MLACGPAAPTGQETSASEITPTPIAIPFNQGATQAQQQVEPASTPDNISTNQQNDGSAQETRDGITMSDDEWYDAQMLKIREGGHSIGTVVAEGYFWRGCSELSNARYNARKLERNRQYDREMFYANGPGAGWGTDTSINGFEAAAQTLEYSDDPRRFCTILEAQIERERARVNEEINSNPDAHAHTTGNSCNATNTNANTVAYLDRLRGCVRQPDPRLQDIGMEPNGTVNTTVTTQKQ